MTIGLDLDGTINNMLEFWLRWLNNTHNTNVQVKDVVEWDISKVYPNLTTAEIYKPLETPEFWSEVSIQEDAVQVIERLRQENHKIYIITSSHYAILPEKLKRCLFANISFLSKEDVIVTYDKSLIRCDLLLDDAEHNLIGFQGIRVLFDAPYNKQATIFDFRVSSWKEFYILISELTAGAPRPPHSRIYQYKAGRGMGKTAWLHQMIYDTTHGVSSVITSPCYLITNSKYDFDCFCRSYFERFMEHCPAKQFELNQQVEKNARFFVDMPSTFPFNSQAFDSFRNAFISRDHLVFLADFETTNWHSTH